MSFIDVQQQFMRHIRDPQNNPAPQGIEDRRLAVYRELFFNNILGFLNSGFPVLESLYSEQDWQVLARRFFSDHDCRSPYFVDISREFVEFLANEVTEQEYRYPFVPELAHYEWLELNLSTRKSGPLRIWDKVQSFNSFHFSPLAELVSYQWPVHQISEHYIPDSPGEENFFFVVHRDNDNQVHFSQINQVTAWLLSQMEDRVFNLEQLNTVMLSGLSQLPSEQVLKATADIVEQMLGKQIFVLPSKSS
ncbi:DNA-binding domain-containing protein [Planctobacterium marinum]|uniref:DUF2063 domain-containing protein n=1 Tax=Planctobacterium marinum TaxID=1631968 RepID=A0AA48I4G4_9ALTE|nr:DUF2063 domain-containing protein [Planctobacterium marinum]